MVIYASIHRQYEVLEARRFVNFKIYAAMQNGSYGNFARMLEFRHIKSHVATQLFIELFILFYLHFT